MSHAIHRPHRNHGLPRVSRLGWLMGLYGENFDRIERLLRAENIPMLSTTHTSIEEISSKILAQFGIQKHMF